MYRQSRVCPWAVKRLLVLLPATWLLGGCAASVPGADAPVPAAEPRDVVRLEVDLVRAQDCEEAFDLALYQSRAVELVAWDDARGRCLGRKVTIRYLTRQATRDEVIRAASSIAAKVTPEKNGEPR